MVARQWDRHSKLSNWNLQETKSRIHGNSMAQQPLKSYNRPLMRVSLSNSILPKHLFFTRGRVIGDKFIASWVNWIWTKILLGREYADYFAQRAIISERKANIQTKPKSVGDTRINLQGKVQKKKKNKFLPYSSKESKLDFCKWLAYCSTTG